MIDWSFADYVLDLVRKRVGRIVGNDVWLAGGSVRDILMEGVPKDYDIFVPGLAELEPEEIDILFYGLQKVALRGGHSYEPFLKAQFNLWGNMVQVMSTEKESMEDLIDDFDWNVSRFAYDGEQILQGMQIEDIARGRELQLHKMTYPISTLRRGYRFSERWGMFIADDTLLQVVEGASDALAKRIAATERRQRNPK